MVPRNWQPVPGARSRPGPFASPSLGWGARDLHGLEGGASQSIFALAHLHGSRAGVALGFWWPAAPTGDHSSRSVFADGLR